MLASGLCICMVGVFVRMSLSGLQSCMDICKLVIFRGGCIYLLSFDWVWLETISV